MALDMLLRLVIDAAVAAMACWWRTHDDALLPAAARCSLVKLYVRAFVWAQRARNASWRPAMTNNSLCDPTARG